MRLYLAYLDINGVLPSELFPTSTRLSSLSGVKSVVVLGSGEIRIIVEGINRDELSNNLSQFSKHISLVDATIHTRFILDVVK